MECGLDVPESQVSLQVTWRIDFGDGNDSFFPSLNRNHLELEKTQENPVNPVKPSQTQ